MAGEGDQASVQTGALPIFCNKKSIKILTFAVSTFDFGFSSVWLRDVPFNAPSFGDAGQVYDPFVYLALLAG